MSSGPSSSPCSDTRRGVSAIRAGCAIRLAPVWRGSCLSSSRIPPGWRCPTASWGCRAVRRAGAGWRSGSGAAFCRRPCTCCRQSCGGARRLDWSRVIVDASLVEAKKGARRSRARSWVGPGSRYHLLVDARGAPLAVTPDRRQRERAPPPAPAPRCRSWSAGIRPQRAVGRPRLRLRRARAGAARAQDRTAHLQAPPCGRPDPHRHAHPPGVARQAPTAAHLATDRRATAGQSSAPTPG